MSDELYYPFKAKWLGKWHTARYLATKAQLEDGYAPGDYEIIGPGERRFNPYGADGSMYRWGDTGGMISVVVRRYRLADCFRLRRSRCRN